MSALKAVSTFGATGQSDTVDVSNSALVMLYGAGVGTVVVERLGADGSTWVSVSKDADGAPASYDKLTGDEISLQLVAPVPGKYRLNCTAYTSGTISYELRAAG